MLAPFPSSLVERETAIPALPHGGQAFEQVYCGPTTKPPKPMKVLYRWGLLGAILFLQSLSRAQEPDPLPSISRALDSQGVVWNLVGPNPAGWIIERAEDRPGHWDSPNGAFGGFAVTLEGSNTSGDLEANVTITEPAGRRFALRWQASPSLKLKAYLNGAAEPEIGLNPIFPMDSGPEAKLWQERVFTLRPGTWRLVFPGENYAGYGGLIDYITPTPLPWPVSLLEEPPPEPRVAGEPLKIPTPAVPQYGPDWSATGLPPGVTLNAENGCLEGTPTAAGVFPIVVTASTAAGSVERAFSLTITPSIAAGMETEGKPLGWSTYASNPTYSSSGVPIYHGGWTTVSHTTWDGIDAVQSRPSWAEYPETLVLSVRVTGPVTAQWRRKDSGGVGYFYLGLDNPNGGQFPVNSAPDANGWVLEQFPIPEGTHDLFFIMQLYAGDAESTDGQVVTLDQFRLNTDGPMIVPKLLEDAFKWGQPLSITMETVSPTVDAVWSASGLPPGLAIDAHTGVITGSPVTSGLHTSIITLTTSAGSASMPLRFDVLPSYTEAVDQAGNVWTCPDPVACGVEKWSDTVQLSNPPASQVIPRLSASIQAMADDAFTFWYHGKGTFILDGQQTILPHLGWRMVRIPLSAGLHTLAFEAVGGASLTLDHFSFKHEGRPEFALLNPTVMSWGELIDFTPAILNGPATLTSDHWTLDPATGAIQGSPIYLHGVNQYYLEIKVTATNALGSNSAWVRFMRADPPHLGLDVPESWGVSVNEPTTAWVETWERQGDTSVPKGGLILNAGLAFPLPEAILSVPVTGPSVVGIHRISTDGYSAPTWSPVRIGNTQLSPIQGQGHAHYYYYQIPAGTHELQFAASGNRRLLLDRLQLGSRQPLLRGLSSIHADVGKPVSVPYTNLGLPGVWSADFLPAGLRLDAETGVLSGVPTADFAGIVRLRATNAEGMFGEFEVDLQIVGPATVFGNVSVNQNLAWGTPRFDGKVPAGYQDSGTTPSTLDPMLSVRFRGPGKAHWSWLGGMEVRVNGHAVASQGNYTNWTPQEIKLPPGEHLIEWFRPTGSFGSTGIRSFELHGYAAFHAFYGLPLSTPLESDADGDGHNLLQEYGWNMDPRHVDRPRTTYPWIDSRLFWTTNEPQTTNTKPTLHWHIPLQQSGLEWFLEQSSDLRTWTPASEIFKSGTSPYTEVHHCVGNTPARYFRLVMRLAP